MIYAEKVKIIDMLSEPRIPVERGKFLELRFSNRPRHEYRQVLIHPPISNSLRMRKNLAAYLLQVKVWTVVELECLSCLVTALEHGT